MFRILFLFLLVLPLVEVYLFIRVGSVIGALPTVFLCILTAMLGTYLFRQQGLQTVSRMQAKIRQGEMPAVDLLEGFILVIASVLLLIPGFFTDIVGMLCLVPGLRTRIATVIIGRLLELQNSHPGKQTVIVEGEFWEDQDKRLP